MAAPEFRYHAFVSCAAEDERHRHWAGWVRHLLESYEVPSEMAGRGTPAGPVPASLFPVYQDTRDLPPEEPLDAATREALEQSRALIVVCSPRAVASRRVMEEVRAFKQLGRERIFALIVAGDPEAQNPRLQCFPDTLRHDIRPDGSVDREWRVHPVAADVRLEGSAEGFPTASAWRETLIAAGTPPPKAAAQAAEYAEKLEGARWKLIAGVLGVPAPEFARQRAPVAAPPPSGRGGRVVLVALLILLGLAGFAGWYAWNAREAKQAAEDDRRRSDNIIARLQRDLGEKLRATNQIALLADANDTALNHFTLTLNRTGEASARAALADSLGDAAEIAAARGDYRAAADLAVQTITARDAVLRDSEVPAGSELRLISDYRRLAGIQQNLDRAMAAKTAEKAWALAKEFAKIHGDDAEGLFELARAAYEAGDLHAEGARQPEALQAFEEGQVAARRLVKVDAASERSQFTLAEGMVRIGRLLQQRSDFSGAIASYREAQTLLTPLVAANPASLPFQAELAGTHDWLASALFLQRNFPEAAAEQRHAVEMHDALARRDPASANLQYEYALALRRLAEYLNSAGPENKTEALTLLQRTLDQLALHFPNRGDRTDLRANNLRLEVERLRTEVLK